MRNTCQAYESDTYYVSRITAMTKLAEMLAGLPPEWPHDVLPEIQRRLSALNQKAVILDDDPTGTQSVHDIPVLTEWGVDTLQAELENDLPAFYVLTNSRALPLEQAQALNSEVGRNVMAALSRMHKPAQGNAARSVAFISRSDSTLRGHFPGEVDALAQQVHGKVPAYLIAPAFMAGGRYTLNDIHYVAYGDELMPAGETEFAKDAAFGYRSSNLREWVEEKTRGAIRAGDVSSISIDDIRVGGPDAVAKKLMWMQAGMACIVNAASERDLEVTALASLIAEADGMQFMYRSAASFARARAGIAPKALLTAQDLTGRSAPKVEDPSGLHGGLIVVGSYVPKTSSQLQALLDAGASPIEVNVEALLDDAQAAGEIARATQQANAWLAEGRDTVLYTSRKLITGNDAQSSLAIGNRVSNSMIAIVKGVAVQPRYVLAKGGITSSDVATKALGVQRAMVLGQILAGVPVWQLGPETRYPNSIYIVFPGNVGGPTALAEVVRTLSK
jgi:uncharacterized protein YgbK (DUF1537 family)